MMVTVELSKGQNTIQRKLKIKLTNIKKKQKKNIQVVSWQLNLWLVIPPHHTSPTPLYS